MSEVSRSDAERVIAPLLYIVLRKGGRVMPGRVVSYAYTQQSPNSLTWIY